MIPADTATDYQRCLLPYVFDRIEVTGRTFIGPRLGTHLMADDERPSEPVAFSLLGAWRCDFPSGPNATVLANLAGEVLQAEGFYGQACARRLSPA